MANLTNWNSLMDKYDLVLFVEFQTMKKIDLERLRENYKAMRRVALSNLNKQLEFLGKQGQLLNIDVSDSELIDSLEEKYQIAERDSIVNYSFYLGATNDNLYEIMKADYSTICGLKIFM